MKNTLSTRLILLLLAALFASHAFAGVFVSVNIAPPALPVYAQPPCPGDGYIWTPGYWAYGEADYYWVPGVWVIAPRPGFLWTPGYWGWGSGVYLWHAGYWGPHVGFYGGVNYGFGYFGSGFVGGRWIGNSYHYNTAITNVNVTNVHNTYIDRTVVRNNTFNSNTVNHSYNGPGGVGAHANHTEQAATRSERMAPVESQVSHAQAAHNTHMSGHGNPGHSSAPAMGGHPHGGGGGGGGHHR